MQKSSTWVALLLVCALLILAGCATTNPDAAPAAAPPAEGAATPAAAEEAAAPAASTGEGKTIILGLNQEPELLNYFLRTQTAASVVAHFLAEGLIDVDEEGNYIPELAEEVPTVENGLVSEDGLTVTYHLKEGLLWSDGTPVTCDDAVFTWEVATAPDSGAITTTGYNQMESVACGEDDRTIIVQYASYYAPFMTMFYELLPRHATGEPAAMVDWEYNWNPLGTGPFVLEEWIRGDRLVLVKNENYRDYPDAPKVDRVIVRIIESREVGKALITSGEIDVLWDLTEADVPEFEANPEITVNARPGPGSERLVLNLADPTLDATPDPVNNPHPILGDLRVRQAIQAGIDKQLLVDELLFGATIVATSELTLGWAQCDIAASTYDPEAAMALLDEAGFTDEDGDGVRECNGCQFAEEGTPIRLKLQTTSGNQLREETQQLIVEMMGEIGIDMYIENVPSAELFGSWDSGAFRKHGNFDVLMYTTSELVDPHEQMFGYFDSSQIPVAENTGAGFNYSRWINATADAAIAEAGVNPDEATRAANYQTVCEQVDAELPHIYLYDRAEVHLSRANITGFVINPWLGPTWNAEEWDKE
jgi:peptide/nickel transport system substrate-binding protein